MARASAALTRYRWLVMATTLMGLGAGFAATRFIDPKYEVVGTVYATPQGPGQRNAVNGPPLALQAGWRDILRSFAIIDPVVQQLTLYVQPDKAADSLLFANFSIDAVKRRFIPGSFTLKTERGHYTLTDELGVVHEEGTVGDSIGRTAGYAWQPSARYLGIGKRTVEFRVVTPREASRDILNRLVVAINPNSPIINVSLTGTATQKPAATLNAMLSRFVEVASDLKQRELIQQATTLQSQLAEAQRRLQDAENGLEAYRVATISKPSELPTVTANDPRTNAVTIGQPVFNSYFARKADADALRHDREAFEKIVATITAPGSTTPLAKIFTVPIVSHDDAAASLRNTVEEIETKEQKLRDALQLMTDSNYAVRDARRDLADLRSRVLPDRLNAYLNILREREADYATQVATATKELQEIPQRTIETSALERERTVAEQLYTQLRTAYSQTSLAQQSAVPDVKVLDSAVMPSTPSSNTAPKMIGLALVLGLGVGLGLAILLDRLDSRFRYPDQARSELGLELLGVVPVVDQNGRQSPEQVAQIVEAFRSIRMNVRYAAGAQRSIAFGITSPAPGDGKSLVASNLALSFAEGGWRTVLIDADTRRGQLNATFDAPMTPGLVDYLEGSSLLSESLYQTRHENLTIVPCGTRHRRAPELLATPRMQQFISSLASDFDVIIIDTPPLGAGTDAYAVGTACGQLALVLRCNHTNLKMAAAKLGVLNQLPVTLLGAVLNEVRTDSAMYQYYSYDPDYVMPEDAPALTAGASGVGTALAMRDE